MDLWLPGREQVAVDSESETAESNSFKFAWLLTLLAIEITILVF